MNLLVIALRGKGQKMAGLLIVNRTWGDLRVTSPACLGDKALAFWGDDSATP